MKITPEQAADVNMMLATFKSFEEQLYNLKGLHGHMTKKYFNELLRVAQRYEKAVKKSEEAVNDTVLDILYNAITEAIYYVRTEATKNYEGTNNGEGHNRPIPSEGDKPKE
tara:strand:- start:3615 stop:3947 length:333 start_codon:yes stop_codon:yes gene_type:complete